jgi:ribosomal-protein-alanine N-acetyltransferase
MGKIEPLNWKSKSGKEIVFRTLIGSDAGAFLDYRRKISEESINTFHYPGMSLPSAEETATQLSNHLATRSVLQVGGFISDQMIGHLSMRVYRSDHPWAKHVGEFGMGIVKEYWGEGIGHQLLQLQDQFAETVGITRIEATVRTTNTAGISLYLRNGYDIEGTQINSAFIDGKYHHTYSIAKILDNPLRNWKPKILQTDRLILRPLELSDAPAIFEYAKNPNVSKYTLWHIHETIADTYTYLKEHLPKFYRKGAPEPMGIMLKSEPSKVIGTVGASWKNNYTMEMGYALAEEHWGKGIVAEAAAALMDYCFTDLKAKRVQAHCKVENAGSARVMQKIGMQFEGTIKSGVYFRERYWDMLLYAKVIG